MKFKDKVVIVTGSSRGIGKRLALGFAREGAKVVVTARTEEQGQHVIPGTIKETAREIEAQGGKALPVRCDVSDEENVSELVRRTLEAFGTVDVLVNNAGVAHYQPLVDIPIRKWEMVMKACLRGPVLCTKAVLPTMIERRQGSIVNVSSIAADHSFGVANGSAYCVAKAGLERLTSAVAEEVLPFNIAVNAVKPFGATYSEGMRYWAPKADFSKWAQTEEYMLPATLFLAAQAASGVTGRIFVDRDLCRLYGLKPQVASSSAGVA